MSNQSSAFVTLLVLCNIKVPYEMKLFNKIQPFIFLRYFQFSSVLYRVLCVSAHNNISPTEEDSLSMPLSFRSTSRSWRTCWATARGSTTGRTCASSPSSERATSERYDSYGHGLSFKVWMQVRLVLSL